MPNPARFLRIRDAICSRVEFVAVAALELLLLVLVLTATAVAWILLINGLRTQLVHIDSTAELLDVTRRTFAVVLTVVLGLELIETLRAFYQEHRIRLEVILVVAIIAVGRHLILVDFEHTSGATLLGLAAVILSLTLGHFFVTRSHGQAVGTAPSAGQTDDR